VGVSLVYNKMFILHLLVYHGNNLYNKFIQLILENNLEVPQTG